MNVFQGLCLGVLQGLTEFLPVSSSGHLVLAQPSTSSAYGNRSFFLTWQSTLARSLRLSWSFATISWKSSETASEPCNIIALADPRHLWSNMAGEQDWRP
ncbi:MAG: hypothetical protein JRI89_17845 [Deltaproteobacteria bacterium]|nr:hypothetical protein [Deltaproteobacteria bacterium]